MAALSAAIGIDLVYQRFTKKWPGSSKSMIFANPFLTTDNNLQSTVLLAYPIHRFLDPQYKYSICIYYYKDNSMWSINIIAVDLIYYFRVKLAPF